MSDQAEVRLRSRAEILLRQMLGHRAAFRAGQWEAIRALVVDRSRVLVVQQTGWGKSLVYFIATKLLREQGLGPTLLVSPLLSLMRNQIAMAGRMGVRAMAMTSENDQAWGAIERSLAAGSCDVLLVSPERLANRQFLERTLPQIRGGIGLLVIDEAHCISDWGHDFRPDYRRIVRIARTLPTTAPVLATTATANDRVVEDIEVQLGPRLVTMRGPLSRRSLRLQAIRLDAQAERLAWLAQHVPKLPGSGIIYCLTVADCERVATWLAARGIVAPVYHADIRDEDKPKLERRLLANEVKALVATVALGMGYDKPDLGFVVHFQRPASVVTYYQQIGRAGRALDDAIVVLLSGREDDEIQEHFIRQAFPLREQTEIVAALEATNGLKLDELQWEINVRPRRLQNALKLLEVDGAVVRESDGRYARTATDWALDEARALRVTAQRWREADAMRQLVGSAVCLMRLLAYELGDLDAPACGRCAACARPFLSSEVDPVLLQEATLYLRRAYRPIKPRKHWPRGGRFSPVGIGPEFVNMLGYALSIYGDAGWGKDVQAGKYHDLRFGDGLVLAAAELVGHVWDPPRAPSWVTAIPSRRDRFQDLVPDFARRLAVELGLPFRPALRKVRDTPEQKGMQNSAQQVENILGAFEAQDVLRGPVLLVDDVVDSGWTLTVCGRALRAAGSGPVYPLALASMAGARGDA